MNKFLKKNREIIAVSVILIIIAYFLINLSIDVRSIKNNFASTTADMQSKILALQSDLATTTKTSEDLSQKILAQQYKSANLDQTLNGIASTVGTLEKLSKTDRELLQKYSKIYFLNENYVPLRLSTIDKNYYQNKDKVLQFHGLILPYLTRMLDDASTTASTAIQIVSAYRSFGTQASLKSSYIMTYGSGANKFSSDQGYSEHQLGTAVDLSSPNTDTLLSTNFESTAAFNWLVNNAYRYGFILSYPKNNSYYQYEPWHWRFVGVNLATKLRNENKHFYDLDQREIDTYLANIFD